jgi:hypothetical protein
MAAAWRTVKTLRWTDESGLTRPLCSASGLARVEGRHWAVGDDLQHVVDLRTGRGHRLFPGELPRGPKARKKAKADLESLIALPGRRLLAFPSGSKRSRTRGALVMLDAKGRFVRARPLDLSPLIRRLDRRIPGLNIEGGFVRGGKLVLLQRGSGRKRFSALVALSLPHFLAAVDGRRGWPRRLKVHRARLGEWDGVPLSLTDAFLHRGSVVVSAAAEDTQDPVRDGRVLGSVIGTLEGRRRPRLRPLLRVPGLKVEGLALESRRGTRATLLAVTDADDPRKPSRLLRLRLAL